MGRQSPSRTRGEIVQRGLIKKEPWKREIEREREKGRERER